MVAYVIALTRSTLFSTELCRLGTRRRSITVGSLFPAGCDRTAQSELSRAAEAFVMFPYCDVRAHEKYGCRSGIARILGVSPQLVTEWLAGRAMPTLDDGLRLQAFLKSNVDAVAQDGVRSEILMDSGSGFSEKGIDDALRRMKPLFTDKSPFENNRKELVADGLQDVV